MSGDHPSLIHAPHCTILHCLKWKPLPSGISRRICSAAHDTIPEMVYSALYKLSGRKEGAAPSIMLWFLQAMLAMWYQCGFNALQTIEIYLLSCWSVFDICFPKGLLWYHFPFAMSNKDPLILAPEEAAEAGEGQRSFYPFLWLEIISFFFCFYMFLICAGMIWCLNRVWKMHFN